MDPDVNALKTRLDYIEKNMVNIEGRIDKALTKLETSVDSFATKVGKIERDADRFRFLLIIVGVFGGVVAWILTNLPKFFGLFK